MDFDEDPLDLLEDDGDGVIETCLFFDEDGKDKVSGGKLPGNSGCCVLLMSLGSSSISVTV